MKLRIALLLAFILLLCGCSNEKEPAATDNFHGPGEFEMFPGGETPDLNAKTLRAYQQETGEQRETTIAFTFVSGSIIAGSSEETAGGIPGYSVYTYQSPARLVVELDNLSYWDYRRDMSIESPLISDVFQYSLFGSSRVYLCFQLTAPVRFAVEAAGDTLTVRLLEQPTGDAQRYYVTANAFGEYRAGTISAEFNASPTRAADMSNTLLISPAFETEEKAAQYLSDARSQYPSIAEEQWQIVQLKDGELPSYNSQLDYLAAYEASVVRLDNGRELVLPVFIPDGLYLCDMPNNAGALYSRELPAEEGASVYQQLYAIRRDGQAGASTTFEFSSIERAQYSPDGRKLAVLERSTEGTHLYVFDADTFELLNDLSEMGFGQNTSTFIWNSLGNTIYAITGVSDVQLHQFDYSIPDETKRHSKVDGGSVDEGALGYSNSELYFAYATLEGGSTIYRIKPEGGVRKPFLSGGSFAVSSDERYMAVVNSNESGGTDSNEFFVYEFDTGAKTVITRDVYPYDFIWSRDCSKLYYIESRLSGGQTEVDTTDVVDPAETTAEETPVVEEEEDPYAFTLWVYDIASGTNQRLFDLSAADIYVGPDAETLYLTRMQTGAAGTEIRATYLLNISAALEEAEAPQQEDGDGALTME